MFYNVFCLFVVAIIFCNFTPTQTDPLCQDVISKTYLPSRNSHISLLKKSSGDEWLIKQRKGFALTDQFMCVLETLGTRMAETAGILCNHVELVPHDSCQQYKRFKNQPATLHEKVPGKPPHLTHEFGHLNIHQNASHNCGKECGLVLKVIRDMATHPALPRIVAFDTYIGNSDRTHVNILYDAQTKNFYAIDFGYSFDTNLAAIALRNLRELDRRGTHFTQRELRALESYKEVLEELLQEFKPDFMYKHLHSIAVMAGFFSKKSALREGKKEVEARLAHHKKFLNRTYTSTQRLVLYLTKFIASHER